MPGENGGMQIAGRRWLKFDPSLSLGNIITLAVLLVAFAIAWSKMDARIGDVEKWQVDRQASISEESKTLERLNTTLELLQQRLADYPLHKHVGNEIIYPGNEPNTEIETKK